MAHRNGESGKLWELIKDIKIAMMVSEDGGGLRSRPMWTAGDRFEGDLWFFTRKSAHKVGETGRHPRVNLAYADPGDENYVSVSGTAELVDDKTRLKELWSEPMRAWFPKGLDDPDLGLLRVTVEQAEYWDAPSSTMAFAIGYVKAMVTGKRAKVGENEKVTL